MVVDPQALPAAMQFLAPWNDGVHFYVPGRVIAPPDQATYQNLRNGGIAADTQLAPDSYTPVTPAQGSFVAPFTDASHQNWGRGGLAGVSAADAMLAKNDGKLDSSTKPAPTLSAVSATPMGAGSVRFFWTTDQQSIATIQFGPTTSYGSSFTAPAGQGAQSYIYGPLTLGVNHYKITIQSIWGTTAGTDQTVTVT
jgi:hypothetical protein